MVLFDRGNLTPDGLQSISRTWERTTLTRDDLAFYNSDMKMVTEPGLFEVWIGSSSDSGLKATFTLKKDVLNEL